MTVATAVPADIAAALRITPGQTAQIAGEFSAAMRAGLAGGDSPLKMLSSFLAKPTGEETGIFLALDFGGTNVRVAEVELKGHGRWHVRKQHGRQLKDLAAGYDYTGPKADADGLFDFLAETIGQVAGKEGRLLGHTFSYPCRQLAVNQAILLGWTKEIAIRGVEGQEINSLLQQALVRRGAGQVHPRAILNDTVATLLAAAYAAPAADLGAICGTGHNTCYYEPRLATVVNMESGNYNRLPFTVYDDVIDRASDRPGLQRLEKMVAGRYLGELLRLIAADMVGFADAPYSLAASDVTNLINGGGFSGLRDKDQQLVRSVARLLVERSARLVAATFLGVLRHIDPALDRQHVLAVDGSLYSKLPDYATTIDAALQENLGARAARITLCPVRDGSAVGAAVAAALAAES